MKNLVLILLLLSIASCSNKKIVKDVEEQNAGIVLEDSSEFHEETTDVIADETSAEKEEVIMADDSSQEIQENSQSLINVAEMGSYTVQKNETLMLVAFKIYGDYSKWKDIANQNQGILNGKTEINEGMVLNYEIPTEQFVWNPNGNPYLIKRGDTLGGISTEVYSTSRKWKAIFENNKPLIKDPNKIFTGFTIYTPELSNIKEFAKN